MRNVLILAMLLLTGCDSSKSTSCVAVSSGPEIVQKVGARDKDGNLLMVYPSPELPVWLKNDYGCLIDWNPNGNLEGIHWADRKTGEILEFSDFASLLGRLEQCPAGATVANFTSCGGGWNPGMPAELREELFATIKRLGLLEPKDLADETLCVCF